VRAFTEYRSTDRLNDARMLHSIKRSVNGRRLRQYLTGATPLVDQLERPLEYKGQQALGSTATTSPPRHVAFIKTSPVEGDQLGDGRLPVA